MHPSIASQFPRRYYLFTKTVSQAYPGVCNAVTAKGSHSTAICLWGLRLRLPHRREDKPCVMESDAYKWPTCHHHPSPQSWLQAL